VRGYRPTGAEIVFECQIDRAQFEALERDLIAEIKAEEDNLRFYRIAELRGYEVREHGCFRATGFDAPLILQTRERRVTGIFQEVRAANAEFPGVLTWMLIQVRCFSARKAGGSRNTAVFAFCSR
jgi:hypothetical protein